MEHVIDIEENLEMEPLDSDVISRARDINKWDQFVIGKINVNFIESLTSRKTIIQILSYLIR